MRAVFQPKQGFKLFDCVVSRQAFSLDRCSKLREKIPSSNEEDRLDEGESSDSDDEISMRGKEDEAKEIEQKTEVPADIPVPAGIVDISCHPKRNIIAAGLIDGSIVLHSYGVGNAGNKHLISFDHHKQSCRTLCFSDSGEHLFTGAQDAIINVLDLETNSVCHKFTRVNGCPPYSMLSVDDYLLASGEDEGAVVLWDLRMQAPIHCFNHCEDFISSLVTNKEKKILLTTSGDGFLSTYNIRRNKLETQSEPYDSELLCAGIVKDGTKVVVGAGDGSLSFCNWGEFSFLTDKFLIHPGTIDALLVIEDDVICTGCEDGKVRAVQLSPKRILGYLGSHAGFTVERVRMCYEKLFIASSSYDEKIKFWDLSGIEELKMGEIKKKTSKLPCIGKESFFSDLQ
ncbi:WD repeat-containing protein 55 [Nephila pilipes]|uniref:WD repeat-containing protein 55 homolog n=1 Tax=Nephila pilipes TaxID=299642 RepID=A0A8X6IPD8_NEPPI|nr:WD repeat-containing protein 55 [Nephila pilipes]